MVAALRMDLLYDSGEAVVTRASEACVEGGGSEWGARGRRLGEQTFSRSPVELEPADGEEGDAWRK